MAIYLASLFTLGPSLSVFLVLVSTFLSELLLRWDRLREGWQNFVTPIVFNISQFSVTTAVTGLILYLSGYQSLMLREANQYLLAIPACIVYLLLNLSFVTGIVSLTEGKSFLYSLRRGLREFAIQFLALSMLALLLTVLYSVSLWSLIMAIIPLALVHVSFRSYIKLQTETRRTFEKISQILDKRDHYTAVHSDAVANLAVKIAQGMKLPPEEVEKVEVAGRVHDIGKIAVPDSILLKPGPLSKEEWQVMKQHPLVSAELIKGLEIYAPVADAVRHEHERYNGSGYPDGLKGEEIPLVARIIAAADIYNALTTKRPYREAVTHEEAMEIIRQLRGTDLDPTVADVLLRVLSVQEQSSEKPHCETPPH